MFVEILRDGQIRQWLVTPTNVQPPREGATSKSLPRQTSHDFRGLNERVFLGPLRVPLPCYTYTGLGYDLSANKSGAVRRTCSTCIITIAAMICSNERK